MPDQPHTRPPPDDDDQPLEPDRSPEATAEAGLTDRQVEEVEREEDEEQGR